MKKERDGPIRLWPVPVRMLIEIAFEYLTGRAREESEKKGSAFFEKQTKEQKQ